MSAAPPERKQESRPSRWVELAETLLLLAASRAVLLVIGLVSRALLAPLRTEPYPWNYSNSPGLSIWGVWDSGWYLDIARFGYSAAGRTDPAILNQANYAFFPLYPLTMRVLGPLVGGPFNAGLIVSNVCLVAACFALRRLVALDHDSETASRAVRYLILFPTAFIFSGVFSESMFLALAIAAFLAVRRDRLLLAGTAGFLAALTRPVGVLLVIPLALAYVVERRTSRRPLSARAGWLALVPLGLASFAAYNHVLTGNPFAFARIQTTWGRTLRSPLAVLADGLFNQDVSALFSAWMTLAVMALLIAGARRTGIAYGVLSLLFIIVPLATGLNSMPRFLLAVFPIPILLARLGERRRVDEVLSLCLALLQGFLMVFWANGFKLVV